MIYARGLEQPLPGGVLSPYFSSLFERKGAGEEEQTTNKTQENVMNSTPLPGTSLSLNYISLYLPDFQTLVSLERLESSIAVFFPLAFNRNLETNFVHPTSLSKIAKQFSIGHNSAWRGYTALIDCGLFTPHCRKGEIRGTLNLSKGGEINMPKKYIKFTQSDFAKLMDLRPFASAVRVLRIIAFRYTNLETGEVEHMPIQRVAEKAAISRPAAYNGYRALIKAKLFEPADDGRHPICGKLLLSCFAKPKTDEPRIVEDEGEFVGSQSYADILATMYEGKGAKV